MVPISYNLRSLWLRRATTLSAAFGIALVVFVLASSQMLSRGIRKTMASSGSDDRAIVLRKGSESELASSFSAEALNLVLAAPGVKQEGNAGLGEGEVFLVIALERSGSPGQVANVAVRGVSGGVLQFRPEVKLVQGRAAKPGTDEIMVGRALVGQYAGLTLGGHFQLNKNRLVEVVGVFESAGSAFESEIWADRDTVQSSFGRRALLSSVTVALDSPAQLATFRDAIENDKRAQLEVFREDLYYEKQSEGTAGLVGFLGGTITFFFALGAIIGAMITMNVAVSNRRREIGVLRALGFSRFAVLSSFLGEACALALIGAVSGALVSLCMASVEISLMNQNTWSRVSFSFEPTPPLLITSIVIGGFMGILGGFLPALRAARTSALEAMKA